MKKIILYVIMIISTNCMGQKKITFNLQQIEFKDMLTKTLFDISKSEPDCFNKNEFYILDFFQSSLSSSEYYLSIDKFFADNKTPNSIAYYVVINNITFFISNKVAVDIFNVLPTKKQFVFKIEEIPYSVGGDYNFLIWRTLSGYYAVFLKSCGE
jgi:DNA polymerase III sliding clamp (beta) subunit (PCNA family)